MTTNQQSNWSLTSHILTGISRPRPGDSKGPTHWPSESSAIVDGKVVGQCRRQAYFRYLKDAYSFAPEDYKESATLVAELKDKEIPVSDYMRFIWAMGELYEEFIVEQSKNTGVFVHGQVPVYIRSHNVSGKLDEVVINPVTGKYSIIEVKSVYGFGGNVVLGTDSERRKGLIGTPRDKNLMQIAIYDWWVASQDSAYEDSRLLYGGRDTGKAAEYSVRTKADDDGIIRIYYKGEYPNKTDWVESPITINSILEQYQYVLEHIKTNKIPDRDFKIAYSREDIDALYKNKGLTKADTEQYEKVLTREAENTIRAVVGEKPKVELKLPEKGDYQCGYCQFKNTCYSQEGAPLEI